MCVRMTKLLVLGGVVFGAACTTTPPPNPGSGITLLSPTSNPVNGSTFRCLGHWPSAMTPCESPGTSSDAATFASDDQNGVVDLGLGRTPIPIDGGNSTVHVQLQFDADGQLSVAAFEQTTQAGDVATIETSDVVSGWLQPETIGRSASERNAGRFDLAFSWGEILGSYDTRPLIQ